MSSLEALRIRGLSLAMESILINLGGTFHKSMLRQRSDLAIGFVLNLLVE